MNNPRYRVLEYGPMHMAHLCDRSDGQKVWVDLMVDGSFPYAEPEELVGKQYDADYDYEHRNVHLAHNVREVTP